MSGLTISNGKSTEGSQVRGGGIYSLADLTLSNCVIRDNQAFFGGGGIAVLDTLTVVNCSFSRNVVLPNPPADFDGGGAIHAAFSTVRVSNCTFDGNSGGTGSAIHNEATLFVTNSTFFRNGGGAVNNFGSPGVSATATIIGCTMSENSGCIVSLALNNTLGMGSASLTLGNTLLHTRFTNSSGNATLRAPTGPRMSVTSLGYNLANDPADGRLTALGDIINTNPRLDPYGLRYNGGYNGTISLPPDSPAIDQGKRFGLTSDQRGQPRPVDNPSVPSAPGGDGSDIGAYEAPADPIQSATNMIVTSLDDHDDGACTGGDCTLREAINRATELPGLNRLDFADSLQGTISLQTRTLGELVVYDSISITGPGARTLALSSDGYHRLFSFLSGVSTVSGLTIRDGWEADHSGAAGTGFAGGIYNQATLTLDDCTIAENRALGGGGGTPGATGGSGVGAGVYNLGVLTVNRCAFVHNRAYGGAGAPNLSQLGAGGNGGPAQGSALFNGETGTLTINNCTFFNNVANGGDGAQGGRFGGNGGNADGAIHNQGAMTVTASTLSGNHGLGGTRGLGNSIANHGVYGAGRAGLFNALDSTVRNTISASNLVVGFAVSVDAHGTFVSEGFNLIGSANNSTGFTHETDQRGTYDFPLDPMLGPMQNNGGETDTMAVRYGSPALDRGQSFGLTTDQRHSPRPADTVFPNAAEGDGADIGAFEVNVFSGPDRDGDGMSDDFEQFYNVNDPLADPDGDRLTNFQESQLGLNPLVFEALNTWSPPAGGTWQSGNNWSTTLPPASNQTCLIINSNSKAVTIDHLTVLNASATLTVNNLSVAAPANMTNTLQLSNMLASGGQPLRVLSSLNILTGGALSVSNSALRVDGASGAALVVDGLLTMRSGSLTLTGAVTSIGHTARGEARLVGGNGRARDVFVGRNSGSEGTLSLAGTGLLSCSRLVLGSSDCGSTGTVAVGGGSLFITNAATNAVLEVRSGVLIISNGTVTVDKIILTNNCASFRRTGGTLRYGTALLDPNADTDTDGMPNGWEQLYRLDPLDPMGTNGAASDLDRDGQTALEEFLAGTDPTDALSAFRILSIVVDGEDTRLRWLTAGGRNNALETASSTNMNFTTIATLVIGGSGPVTNTYVDVGAVLTSSNRYYRVRLVQ